MEKRTFKTITGCYVEVTDVVNNGVLIIVNEPNGILTNDEFILVSSVTESVLKEAYENRLSKEEMIKKVEEVLDNLDCLCFGYQLYSKWIIR